MYLQHPCNWQVNCDHCNNSLYTKSSFKSPQDYVSFSDCFLEIQIILSVPSFCYFHCDVRPHPVYDEKKLFKDISFFFTLVFASHIQRIMWFIAAANFNWLQNKFSTPRAHFRWLNWMILAFKIRLFCFLHHLCVCFGAWWVDLSPNKSIIHLSPAFLHVHTLNMLMNRQFFLHTRTLS